MSLFSKGDIDAINKAAVKTPEVITKPVSVTGLKDTLDKISAEVSAYFSDSEAILITNKDSLHEYITGLIEYGFGGIDTETTGLDRINDTIVGLSLYYPDNVECYIPINHKDPIFEQRYKDQLNYQDVSEELKRIEESNVKLIFANADFDLSMIYKDLKVDLIDRCFYDVILAWRCLKEDEKDNALKVLYNKYVMKGKGDPKKFSDFFSPKEFPFCKPNIAGLYAANDAKITYDLFLWQLPYVTPDNEKCKKNNLQNISSLVWDVEMPLIKVCQKMHRTGMYVDKTTANVLIKRYDDQYQSEMVKLQEMIDDLLSDRSDNMFKSNRPFTSGKDFNPNSTPHVKYLLYDLMNIPQLQNMDKKSTDKRVLADINIPVTNQILKVRSLKTLISTFVEKLPQATTNDSRIHAQFRQIGASTGRFCISKGTKITVLNGLKNIEDIVPGDLVYCYDNDGNLQLSPVKNIWLTGTNKDCVTIKWQSSGKGDVGELICTPEHRILMKTGRWVRADELKRYDKVAHLRRTVSKSRERRPDLYGWNNIAIKEQDVIKYSIFGCTDSSNYVIHHKDEDPNNNDLSNLELMTIKEHVSYHAKKLHREGRIKYSHLQDDSAIATRVARQRENYIIRTLSEKDKLLQMIKDCNGRLSQVDADFNSFKHRCQVAGIDVESECQKYNPRYHKRRISEDEFKSIYEKYQGLAVRVTEHFNISYDKFYKYCEEYGISRNHMILSVKPAGKYDVYDIEVEGYHNFIANEICVHNSSASPNLQNIPSNANDIRHMFRATPGYVMLSSDYSAQEPRITAYVSQDPKMIKSFQEDRDIYASIASLAFKVPYEKCLEFNPITGENQPEGKHRRTSAKFIVLGITYGRSVPSIADQLYGKDKNMSDEDKVKEAQKVYDGVLNAFPKLRSLMVSAQKFAKEHGYVETILGRRRHLPDMKLNEFDFVPMKGYVNPDVDPLDPSTLKNKDSIPKRVVDSLRSEFKQYKYYGQIAKRTRQLYENEHIRVINNRPKINDATRQTLNCVSLDTEILTKDGWKNYSEISVGDDIFSYDIAAQCIKDDKITDITVSYDTAEVVEFRSPSFHSISTMNHRWVVGEYNETPRIKLTQNIFNNRWPDYPILRVADNFRKGNCSYSDDELKFIGWMLTDGGYDSSISLYQSTRVEKNNMIYRDMVDTLDRLGLDYTDRCSDGVYHELYVKKCSFTDSLKAKLPNRILTGQFVSSLSQHQANIVMWSMIEGDGTLGHNHTNITYACDNEIRKDMFQYLAFIAGYATNSYKVEPELHNQYPSSNKLYDSVSNKQPIHITKPYYIVSVLRIRRAQIYPHHKLVTTTPGVWCPTTGNGTWIARYKGKVFITGNSIIQGSAADQTKLAILLLENNEEWKKMGGRLLVPVHDELICEVPIENWKEGGELLSKIMCDAADFLPFPSKCDVTTTIRWYGLEYPCQYTKPEKLSDISSLSSDEIKWIQYHLVELEYILPVFNNEDGSSPQGDAAVGVNGKYTDELVECISDYIQTRNISDSKFIDNICYEVKYGKQMKQEDNV